MHAETDSRRQSSRIYENISIFEIYALFAIEDARCGVAMMLFLFIVCSVARLHAQGYAKIVGTIADPSGAVVPNATITAVQTQNGQ